MLTANKKKQEWFTWFSVHWRWVIGTITVNDAGEKAKVLSELFASVYTIEPQDLYSSIGDRWQDIANSRLITITPDTVYNKLNELNPSKSPGLGGIHPRVLQEAKREPSSALSIIFNKRIKSGELPTRWKVGNILAIYKKGKKLPRQLQTSKLNKCSL